jgi:sugar phosphate permease
MASNAVSARTTEAMQGAKHGAARWWLVAPTLILFVIINQLDKSNISVLIADRQFLSDLHLTGQPARIGFLSSAFFYAYGASLMIWGFMVDRFGPRRAAIWGVLGWAVTTAWCAIASSATEMYAARFALGLAEGCMWPVCNSYAGRWFAAREHGRIQAFWVNGTQIGIAVGLPIVTAFLFVGGWRTVFWACSVGSVLILLPMFLWLAPDQPAQSRFVKTGERLFIETHRATLLKTATPAKFVEVLKDRRFWLVTLCHACLVATFFGLTTWIPTYLTQARGMAFSTMSASVSLSYLIPITLALLIGYISDRTMLRAPVAAACSIVMAAMIFAAVMVPNAIVSMLLLVISFAAPITYGATNTSLLHVLAPADQVGRSTGICVGVGNVLGAAAPTIIGYLIGLFSGKYLVAFGFIAALNILQAGLYLMIGNPWKGAVRA